REISQDLVLHAVGEEAVLLVCTEILKREHRDAFLRDRRHSGEFLEAWIISKQIEHGIESEQRGSERARRESALVRDREKFLQSGEGAVGLSHRRRHPGEDL